MGFAIENPLSWAHFRLRGGLRTMITSSLGLTVIIVGLIFVSVRADPPRMTNTLATWTQGLMALQMGLLVLFAAGAIRNAVRKDFTTRMIESHRLMPISGAQAVVGYIIGASTQFAVLSLITLLIGCVTSSAGGLAVNDWLLANAILGIFVLCLWVMSVFAALLGPAPFGLVIIIALAVGNGALAMAVPGLSVIIGPLIGRSVFGIVSSSGTWDWAHQVSALVQLSVAGFCFLGAVRKYRREDVLAFLPQVGLLMLIGWLGVSVLGIKYFDEFQLQAFFRGQHDMQIPVIGSVLSSLLFAILPVMSGVWQRRQWLGRRARHDIALGSPPSPPEIIAISAAAFIALFGLSIRNGNWPYLAITTAGAALSFLLAMTYLLGIMYRAKSRGGFIIGMFLFVTWLLPFGFEGARYAMQQDLLGPELTWLSTCSPIGALIVATSEGGPSPLFGILVQFVPAVLLGLLYYRPRRAASLNP